jgi:protein-disulfide isomerase
VAAVVLSSNNSSSTSAGSSGGASGSAATALFEGLPQQGVTLGRASAPATLMEFADLQCPYCAEYNDNALPTVVKRYVRTGRIRYQLYLRSFLGPDSVKAAGAAAVAAKENRLFPFADLFYHRQRQENTGYVTGSFLRGVAQGSGVDAAKALAGAGNPSGQPLVARAEKLATQLGSNSTPAFYLRLKSGRLVPVEPKALDAPSMTAALDAALGGT